MSAMSKSRRYFIIGIAMILMVFVVVGAWGWVTWPERVASEFARALAEGRSSDAERLYSGDNVGFDFARRHPDLWYDPPVAYDRSWLDMIAGQQGFNVWPFSYKDFKVVRGKVVFCCSRAGGGFDPFRFP